MKIFNIPLLILLINFSYILLNCTSYNNKKNVELEQFCMSFVKAICTKDTISFYHLVDKEKLTIAMNAWMNNDKKIKEEEIYFPFFFVYSPLKIREEDLLKKRGKDIFFSEFIISDIHTINNLTTKLKLEWKQNQKDAINQSIELILKKEKEWIVINSKWATL